jgi:negative regulator of sigma E activity
LLRGSYDYATSHHVDFTGKAAAAIENEVERHARRRAAGANTEANTGEKKAAAE